MREKEERDEGDERRKRKIEVEGERLEQKEEDYK